MVNIRNKKRFCKNCEILIYNKEKNSVYCKECAEIRIKHHHKMNNDLTNRKRKIKRGNPYVKFLNDNIIKWEKG